MVVRAQHLYQNLLLVGVTVLVSSFELRPLSAQVPLQPSNINQAPAPVPPPQDIQPPPSPLPLPAVPEPIPETLPPPADLLQPPTIPPDALPGEVPTTVQVERFEVVGSTVFSEETLAEVTAPFTNRPLSFAELLQARSAVTQLYIQQGYINSGAYIPPQTLQDGVVTIQVLEGELETITVSGTRRLNSSYVRDRIAVAASRPLNVRRLLEGLQLLQLDPLIENLSAELSAGSRPGQSLLEVQVREADSFQTQLVADNGRSPSVGSFRRRVQVNEANLLGLGDGIGISYSNTDGSDSLDASYTLPINPRNGSLSLSYGRTSSNVIEPPFDVLGIEAASRYYEFSFRQPLVQTPTQEFALGLTASRRESETALSIANIGPFPLSPGADEQGRTRISALRFFQEWTQRNSEQVVAVRSQFSLGLDALNATVNESDPDSRFFAWRGQGQWVRLLAPDTLLVARGDVQLADQPLVPLEQFGLGGQDTVRGYRQDLLLSDNGLFASVEVRLPIYRSSRLQGLLQIAPFIDFGTAWNSGENTDVDPNTITSAGLGLLWRQGDRLTARLDWGIPLTSVSSRERTWQENGLYFSIIYSPF